MIGKFYVGHEVVLRRRFAKYAFAQDLIGCNLNNMFFVSKEVVLLERDKFGNYSYVNNHEKCNVLDPNSFEVTVSTLGCNYCNQKTGTDVDCELQPDMPDKKLGVVDVQPIFSFAKTSDWTLAIELIKEYNESVKDEYVSVDDFIYVDTIIEIDEGISKSKIK